MTRQPTPVESVAITEIVVGQRRRTNLGRLVSLKSSIERRGLLHPIILRNGNELVAGARRLEACRQLGWDRIPARRIEMLDDDGLRAIELEENEERLALADYESSRQRLAEIRQAEAAARAEAQAEEDEKSQGAELRCDTPRNSPKPGRPSKKGSKRDTEAKTGISRKQRARVEQHVSIADRFPFMQREPWKQYTVLEAGEKLEQIPRREHPSVAVLLDQPGVPPKAAIKLLSNLGTMPAEQRASIYDLAKSSDPEDRGRALTEAAQLPKSPHGCLLVLMDLRRSIASCRREHRGEILEALDNFIAQIRAED